MASKTTATTTAAKATTRTTKSPVQAAVAKVTRRAKVESKVCRVCGLNKPLTEYRVKQSRPDGRDSICAVDARLWLANRKAVLAKQAKTKPVAKVTPKQAAKPVATAKAATRKPVAKPAAKVTLPAREAAARAKDAQAKVTSVAK
jgi:hypothetical protein